MSAELRNIVSSFEMCKAFFFLNFNFNCDYKVPNISDETNYSCIKYLMDDFDEAFNSHFEYFEVKIFVILKFENEK